MEAIERENGLTGLDFLSGGGEMGQRIRDFDWSSSALGTPGTWPQSLRTCIRIMLSSRQPIWIGWGKDLVKFYNDPYQEIVGGKHPWALGKPASEVWSDIWVDIEPMLHSVMEKDEGTYVESQLLVMERNGYPEETYYTFSYTPIPGDDGKTAGMICANSDDTDRIISERQLSTLTNLGKKLTDVKTTEGIISETMACLRENPWDFPFAFFYGVNNEKAALAGRTQNELSPFPLEVPLMEGHPFGSILQKALVSNKSQTIPDLHGNLGALPKGAWHIEASQILAIPFADNSNIQNKYGVLITGCNPYRLLDEKFLGFVSLVSDQISKSFATVHSLEEERKRAAALAELDKAKTTFFSNISHEFRTPLTLLLGPIEETLLSPENVGETKARMEVALRNGIRLQRLVNTLLEFSKIEAGRMEGSFSPVDIGKYTADLASSFRSAIEKAGMELIVTSGPVSDAVYVDVEMWERIVMNLISNAFKYSNRGQIVIETKQSGTNVVLSVRDTGIGIPEDQLPNVFDRFHRIENSEGRSKEGTGIGLAMVKELVRLHGGSVEVTSTLGIGSVFTVTIPTGKAHLSRYKILEGNGQGLSGTVHSTVIVGEALRWLPNDITATPELDPSDIIAQTTGEKKYTVMLADDNADMREYVQRLLARHYHVINVKDGEEAFRVAIKKCPDLILSDIMMPKVDGFGLLKLIRGHADTRDIPVIFLSARAGDEAKVEGLEAGADDYLIKPFSAKELMARVDANIRVAKHRLAAESNLKNAIMNAPVAMTMLKGKDLVIEIANDRALELWGKRKEDVINKPALVAFPELVSQGFDRILNDVFTTGQPFIANELPVNIIRHGKEETLYINFIYECLKDQEGNINGIMGVGIDVSEQIRSRKVIEEGEARARLAIDSAHLGTYEIDFSTNEMKTSDRFNEIWGVKGPMTREQFAAFIHPDDLGKRQTAHEESLTTGLLDYEARILWKGGTYHWVRVKGKIIYDADNRPATLIGVIQDITDQKLFTQHLTEQVNDRTIELKRSNEDLQQFAHVASHDLKEPVRKIRTFTNRLLDEYGENLPETGKQFVLKIQHASERMVTMIDGVLAYSKLNIDELIENVSIDQIIDNIESDLELVMEQKSAMINRKPLGSLEGSYVLMHQLFYNIINNSLKFAKDDEPCRINIGCQTVELDGTPCSEITISDNGIGFEQEYAERIFKTFLRLNSKDKYEGTGLGLSLCKKIVERHHGTIYANGELGKGAVITIVLPVKQPSLTV